MSSVNTRMAASHTEMRIEVDDGDGSVSRVDRSKQWKDDCVITTKCDDARVIFPVKRNGNKLLPSHWIVTQWGICFTVKQGLVSIFDLLNCIFVVVWADEGINIPFISLKFEGVDSRYRYIAAIDKPEACIEGINFERNVVSTIKRQTTGTCTNAGYIAYELRACSVEI